MSKAEERALEAYPPKLVTYGDLFGEETLDENGPKRTAFIKGYQQAEKDLKSTVKEADLHKEIIHVVDEKTGDFYEVEIDKTKVQKGE